MVDATTAVLIIVVAAFVPPLLFLGAVRRMERYGREPWGRVLRTFMWGAVFAVIIAIVLQVAFLAFYQEADRVYVLSGRINNLELIVLALVLAPLTEDFAKGVGVYFASRNIDEPEDGLVYGAASGFGFAASENVLYGLAALVLTGSLGESLLVVGIRSISSALLHASSTATFGYGIARAKLWPHLFSAFPYYLLAVMMHSVFNFLASFGELERARFGEAADLIGLVGAIAMAGIAFTLIRRQIGVEDRHRLAW